MTRRFLRFFVPFDQIDSTAHRRLQKTTFLLQVTTLKNRVINQRFSCKFQKYCKTQFKINCYSMLKIRPVFKFNKIESSVFSRIKTFLQNFQIRFK